MLDIYEDCPYCGSSATSLEDDNIDFLDNFGLPFEYEGHFTCDTCGAEFDVNAKFAFSQVEVFVTQDGEIEEDEDY